MMYNSISRLGALILSFYFCLTCYAVPRGFVDEGVTVAIAITGAFAPNPRQNGKPMLLLSSKEGIIRVLEDPDESDETMVVLDIENRICHNGERGLQSIRPHPDFAENRYIYLFYASLREGCLEDINDGPPNRLSRFTMDANTLQIDIDSEVKILQVTPTLKRVHNGGNIAFGVDRKLYVTTGDGGSRNPAVSQDLGHLHGKILRLNDDGSIPNDNPYAFEGVACGEIGGYIKNGICSEVFAVGFRNPFRLAMDPNSADKVKFHIGDVGASSWEEISVGGADYAKANYGWPPMEGPCDRGSNNECPIRTEYEDPIYYYEHTKDEEGGAVTGSVFVPDGIWPSAYKFLYIDFIFGGVYNLIRDKSLECRDCVPPVPGYRNETFHEHKDMVDLFFGPYKDTQALYIVSRSDGQNIRRIIYTGTNNRSPIAMIEVESSLADVGERVFFDGRTSSDPDGDGLTFNWDFGDGETSTDIKPAHRYKKKGQYTVTLIVTDDNDQSAETFVVVQIGSPPTGTILSPAENEKFYVGQIIRLLGSGKDSLGKELNSSHLVWEVQQHHASHFHPFLDKTTGNDFDLFAAPEPEDFKAATISFLKIILYVSDDDGLTTEVVRIVDPILVLVDVDSQPRNLSILVDEFRVTTPATITTWENHNLRLDVEDQYPFLFDSWSDGGERSHKMQIPKASLTTNPHISATFEEDSLSYQLIDLVSTIKNCSSTDMCGRCQGHCQSDAECMGTLICYKKVARNESVPGCLGLDASNTDWCALSSFSTLPPTEVSTPSPTFGLWNPSTSLSFGVSDAATPSPTARATYAPPVAIPDPGDTQSPITFAPVSSSNFISTSMTLTPIMSSIQLIESPGLKGVRSDSVAKQWIFTFIITLSIVFYNSF